MGTQAVHLIFYVRDQKASTDFYANVLRLDPVLNVPGMTEFALGNGTILGLMPEKGIVKLLGAQIEDPAKAQGIPRSELYLIVDRAHDYLERVVEMGGRELSPLATRDWGDTVAYYADPDGHVLAFAERTKNV